MNEVGRRVLGAEVLGERLAPQSPSDGRGAQQAVIDLAMTTTPCRLA
jgi:hypothetical protein